MGGYPIRAGNVAGMVTGVLLAVLAMATGGCDGDQLPVGPVQGTVLYRGKPLEFGTVVFQPNTGPPGRGTIQPDGTFRLSTYGSNDGAVIGKYWVRIVCSEDQQPGYVRRGPDLARGRSLIPEKYSHIGTSGLEVEVKRTNHPFVFELTD